MMKKNTITLLACVLALMFLMNNCKKKNTDPLTPNQGLIDDINKVEVATATLVPAKPVVFTESKFEASAEATTLNSAITSVATSGVIPANVIAAGADISAALTPEEMTIMSSITPQTLALIESGGALPANLQAILTKAEANSALAVYFPGITLPTVEGVQITGLRTSGGVPESIEQVGGVLVSDVCLAAAEAEFQKVKTKLDASRTSQLAGVAAQFTADIAPLAAAQALCLSAVPTKYDALRAGQKTVFTALNALLDANQNLFGPLLYIQIKVYLYAVYIGNITSLNMLQKADTDACVAKTAAATTNAEAARDANALAVEAVYATAIAEAEALKGQLAESCHNQGGGL